MLGGFQSAAMRRFRTLPTWFALAAGLLAFAKTGYAQQVCERAAAREAYRVGFAETQTTLAELAWSGDATNCLAGEPSSVARLKSQVRLNYLRSIVGLAPVTFDSALDTKAQAAALMMHAQNALNHYPDSSYACYSATGAEAAGKSNLYLGRWGAAAIVGYVEDPGSNNGPVGHRRWILYPRAKAFGHGFTNRADALWVIGERVTRPENPEFVAWPTAGYHPINLVHPRWSFALPSAGFESAKVSMTNPAGGSVSLVQLASVNGYGDNTLVWEPAPGSYPTTTREDLEFVVWIDSVKVGSEYRTFSYTVTMFDPTSEGCPDGQARSAQSCACSATTAVDEAGAANHLTLVYLRGQSLLELRGAGLGEMQVGVYDLMGRRLHLGLVDGRGQLTLPRLQPGMYVARARDERSRKAVLKFVVE